MKTVSTDDIIYMPESSKLNFKEVGVDELFCPIGLVKQEYKKKHKKAQILGIEGGHQYRGVLLPCYKSNGGMLLGLLQCGNPNKEVNLCQSRLHEV